MSYLLRKLFDVNRGEEQKALLMFSYIFFIIASLLILKSIRDSLLLIQLGIESLPYAFLLTALSAVFIMGIYTKIIKKIKFNKVILYTTFFWIGCLIVFRVLLFLNYQAKWFIFTFYIWVAIFAVLSTSQFWLFANYVFNAREAKRLFGFVGTGGIIGGILGGYMTSFFVRFIGTDNMLFFCIGFLSVCIFIFNQLWNKTARFNYVEKLAQEKRTAKLYGGKSPYKLILKSRHLTLLASIIAISVIVGTMVHYQFGAFAKNNFSDRDQLTAFLGFWLSNLGIASLVIQIFFTRRIIKFFGVITSLLLLPLSILFGSIGLLIHPALWSAIIIKMSDGGFKQSINRSGIELIILPVPSEIKNKSKTFIDVLVDSLATGFGGVLLILVTRSFGFSLQQISLVNIFLIALWFYFVIKIGKEYKEAFRIAIEKRSIDLNEQNLNFEDASVMETIHRILEGNNERQILYVLKLIENIKNKHFVPLLKKLIHHSSPEIKIQGLNALAQYKTINLSSSVQPLIKSPYFDVQVASICYLYHHSKNGIKTLQKFLAHTDNKIQSAALICAANEYRENETFRKLFNLKHHFETFLDEYANSTCSEADEMFVRVNLAKVIGIANNSDLHPFLLGLLHDNCPDVLENAILSAGKTKDPTFIPLLIQHLKTRGIRKTTGESLANYGNTIVDIFDKYLANLKEERHIHLQIPKVLERIGSQESVNMLFKHSNQKDLLLRFRIIKALSKLKITFPMLKFSNTLIDKNIDLEIEKYIKKLSFLFSLEQIGKKEEKPWIIPDKKKKFTEIWSLLLKSIHERLDEHLEIIFILLGMKYLPADINNAYRAIISNKPNLRANAIEFLDNTLRGSMKKHVMMIVEFISQKRFDQGIPKEIFKTHNSVIEILKLLLDEDDYWIKVCILYLIAESNLTIPKHMIQQYTKHPDFKVREVAEYALIEL